MKFVHINLLFLKEDRRTLWDVDYAQTVVKGCLTIDIWKNGELKGAFVNTRNPKVIGIIDLCKDIFC